MYFINSQNKKVHIFCEIVMVRLADLKIESRSGEMGLMNAGWAWPNFKFSITHLGPWDTYQSYNSL